MLNHQQHQAPADLIPAIRDGFRSGIARGELTKGHRLTQQVTEMLDGILEADHPIKRDWRIGQLVGLVQWTEANYTAQGSDLQNGGRGG